jgi:hypothetical protein
MKSRRFWRRSGKIMLVVAPASARTWAVALSRRLIPGAVFRSREAAIRYAAMLARAAGLGPAQVKVLGVV